MRRTRDFVLLAALLAIAAPVGRARAEEPRGAWLLRRGADTLAIERYENAGGRIAGTLVSRLDGSRTDWEAVRAADGTVARMNAAVRLAGDPAGEPARHSVTLEFGGDSVFVDVAGKKGSVPQRIRTAKGAMPFMNPSVALVVALAQQWMPAAGTSAKGALFLLAGGQTVEATVSRPSPDSIIVAFAGVSFRFALDRALNVTGGAVPEQGLAIERAAALPAGMFELPKPDYSAPSGAPYTAEEVKVPARGGFVLAGTLTSPVNARPAACVVTITGSGPEDRDEALAIVKGYRPFREIADALGRRGIAVLRLDDRGVGGSGGESAPGTSEDFANDIEDAVRWLRGRAGIDPARIALLGHSEGGLIAPMLAARDPKLRGIVLLAGPAWTGRRILEYQNSEAIGRSLPAASRDSALRAAMVQVDSLSSRSPWLRFFLDYDPLPTARKVRVPVLVLQGATDHQVTAVQADELAEAFRRGGNRDVTERVYPARNHLFVPDDDGSPAGYRTLRNHEMGPPVLSVIAEWLERRLK